MQICLPLNGKKMAKSTGNNILPDEMFSGNNDIFSKPFSPAVTRFFLLQAHYRSIVDLSEDALLASEKGFHRLTEGIHLLDKLVAENETKGFDLNLWSDKCYQAMNDDFNSPVLIAQLFDAVKFINSVQNGSATISAKDLAFLKDRMKAFTEDVLGLSFNNNQTEDKVSTALEGTVNLLIEMRKKARDNKDFVTSDAIRDQLFSPGYSTQRRERRD